MYGRFIRGLRRYSENRERNGNHTTFSAGLKDSSARQIRLKKNYVGKKYIVGADELKSDRNDLCLYTSISTPSKAKRLLFSDCLESAIRTLLK
jgi:hypothetical protein